MSQSPLNLVTIRRRALMATSTLALTLSAFSSSAFAQNSGVNNSDEIIVTARKRDETLQEVPVAISVFNGAMLEENAISSARDLYANTPGLNYDTGFDQNAATPAIRGVTSNEIATYRQKVTTFLDGMPILGQQGTVPFLAIDQVEVLRGPQSAAFGRSTFGGAINYTTRDPKDSLEAEANIDIGSDNLIDVSALLAGPIAGDQLGGLLAVSSRTVDGDEDWVTEEEGITLGGETALNVLGKLVWTPTDALSLEARYKYTKTDNEQTPRAFLPYDTVVGGVGVAGSSRVIHPDAPSTVTDCGAGPGQPSCVFVGELNAVDQTYDYNYGAIFTADGQESSEFNFVRDERTRFELEGNYDFENGYSAQALGFVSEEAYERGTDSDLTNNTGGFERDPTDIEELYYEARILSPGEDRFRWGAGFSRYEYDFLTLVVRGLADFNEDPINGRRIAEKAENTGVFFNTTYDITDQITGSFEGRYQIDNVSGDSPQSDGTLLEAKRETKAFLPRVSLTYSPQPDMTFYGQYAKGNNPSGVNSGALDTNIQAAFAAFPDEFPTDLDNIIFFDEETVDSFEVGVKGRYAEGWGTYALNVYALDWKGYVQAFNLNFEPDDFVDIDDNDIGDAAGFSFVDGDGITQTVPAGYLGEYEGLDFGPGRSFLTAGDAEAWGIEFETNINLSDNWSLGAAASYIHMRYADNACSTRPLNYGVVANAETEIGLPCVSIAGNEISTQPALSGSANLGYSVDLDNGMEFFARGSSRYVSDQYVSEMNLSTLPAYFIADVRAGVSRDAWRAEAYITNLFDNDAPQGPQIFHDGTVGGPPPVRQNTVYTTRRDRGFGMRFSYKYGQ